MKTLLVRMTARWMESSNILIFTQIKKAAK